MAGCAPVQRTSCQLNTESVKNQADLVFLVLDHVSAYGACPRRWNELQSIRCRSAGAAVEKHVWLSEHSDAQHLDGRKLVEIRIECCVEQSFFAGSIHPANDGWTVWPMDYCSAQGFVTKDEHVSPSSSNESEVIVHPARLLIVIAGYAVPIGPHRTRHNNKRPPRRLDPISSSAWHISLHFRAVAPR